MAISIVSEVPVARDPLARLGRLLVRVLGGALVLVGLLAAIVPILYLGLDLAALLTGERDVPKQGGYLVAYTAASAVSLFAGLRLLRGKRGLVLFLRRFGFTDATQAVTFAVVKALGGRWRLVTLDDAQVAPVGTPARARRISVAFGLVAVAVVAVALFWTLGGGFQGALGQAFDTAMRGATLGNFLQRAVIAFVAALMVMVVVVLFVFIPAAFALAVAVLAGSSYRAIRRAERAKTVTIADDAQIEPRVAAVLGKSRGIVGPGLAVAKVDSAIWQPVVRRLASASSAVIIDISQPTTNLLWEIESLRSEQASEKAGMRARWILVGEQTHLARMTAEAARNSAAQARLLQVLDGEQVLAYSGEKTDLARFARSLRARLDALRSA